MTSSLPHLLSRRHFCFCCIGGAAFGASNGWLTPRQAFAEARGIVSLIKDSAATSPIVTHRLRNNISVFEGSGGKHCRFHRRRRQSADRCRHRCVAASNYQGAGRTRRRARHPSRQHPLAFRSCRRQRMAAYGWGKDYRSREHPQASFRNSTRRGLGLQFPSTAIRWNSQRSFCGRVQSQAEWPVDRSEVLRARAHRQRHFRDLCRGQHRACWRYLLERYLSAH